MYTIIARWAGYELRRHEVTSRAAVTESIEGIEEQFIQGIEHNVLGSMMSVTVLCVDVLEGGEIVEQIDFKK